MIASNRALRVITDILSVPQLGETDPECRYAGWKDAVRRTLTTG
jgi:hypothetical protein